MLCTGNLPGPPDPPTASPRQVRCCCGCCELGDLDWLDGHLAPRSTPHSVATYELRRECALLGVTPPGATTVDVPAGDPPPSGESLTCVHSPYAPASHRELGQGTTMYSLCPLLSLNIFGVVCFLVSSFFQVSVCACLHAM